MLKRQSSSRSVSTTTRSTRIHFLDALSTIPVPKQLITSGAPIQIVAANGKTEPALLYVSHDKFTVTILSKDVQAKRFFSSAKPSNTERALDIGEMDRIQRGQSTQQFEKAKKKMGRVDLVRNSSTASNNSATGSTTTSRTLQQLDPERSFSIIFRGEQTLDLMAMDEESRDEICHILEKILLTYQMTKVRVANDVLLLRYVWLNVDVENRGLINVDQFRQVLQQINFYMKPRQVNDDYEKFGKVIGLNRDQRRRGLTFEQSAVFLHKIKRDHSNFMRKPVDFLWNGLFGELMNNGKIRETVSDRTFLEKFLHSRQGEYRATLTDVRKLFRRLHDMEIAHTKSGHVDLNRITKDQFEAHLLARDNYAFDPVKEEFNIETMNQPLSQYWINSSHNTYLIGDQYTSHSSVEMYSNALYRGARCLELDIWDGPKSTPGNVPVPVVWHGHTMTTKIRFIDIIKTIKVFLNFHPDTFPIILSFENHCSIPYQEVMAEVLERVLGDSLYVPSEVSLMGRLPTPAQLRGMVVIKGRRPLGTEADTYDTDDESDDEGATSSMGDSTIENLALRKQPTQKFGVAPQLAKLTLFHGHKLEIFEYSMRAPTHHMHSFSENKVRSQCRQKQSVPWIIYNQTHMSRTYPAGSRLDSSNYNPLLAWSTGCQMVALNFQTEDAFLRLNDGRFQENGQCGYVLKPTALMIKDLNGADGETSRLSIRVLSGSCLPKPRGQRTGDCIDPYVKVAVFDVKNEERETTTTYVTGIVPSNGFFPNWGFQEKFTFTIENWSVAMLQLTVYDKKSKDDFIAVSSIPLSCLRCGIRSVKLFGPANTRSGVFDFATLLLDIKVGKLVAEI